MKNNIFLLLIGVLLVSCQTDEEKAEDAFERAQEQLESGNLSTAKRYFNDAIKLDSNDSRYWSGLGSVYSQLNNHRSIIKCYTKAIKLNPYNSNFWFLRARSRFDVGDYEGAMNDCSKALEINPNESDYWNLRGNLEFRHLNSQMAIDNHTYAIQLEPKGIYFSDRARAKMRYGDKEGACADARVAEQMGEDVDISEYCD